MVNAGFLKPGEAGEGSLTCGRIALMIYPNINKVAVPLGPVDIHWYGITYIIGFLIAYVLLRVRARQEFHRDWKPDQISDLVFYGALGAIIGGRLGYVFFYNFSAFLNDPVYLFRVWDGGMAFHGGFLGALGAAAYYSYKTQRSFLAVVDFAAPVAPLGLFAGRIGNFINGELWGKTTSLPWGVQLPCDKFKSFCTQPTDLYSPPLHPAQLYEGVLEGLVLFAILWLFARRARPPGAILGLFLIFYGLFRFLVEFVRLPDSHIGYLMWNWVTMGQVLSLPMIIAGGALVYWSYTQQRSGLATPVQKR